METNKLSSVCAFTPRGDVLHKLFSFNHIRYFTLVFVCACLYMRSANIGLHVGMLPYFNDLNEEVYDDRGNQFTCVDEKQFPMRHQSGMGYTVSIFERRRPVLYARNTCLLAQRSFFCSFQSSLTFLKRS